MNSEITKAVKVLNSGGILIFPTDTVYGVGCRVDDQKAVEKLFRIRNRPTSQAAPVLVSSIQQAEDYFTGVTDKMKNLMAKYWPGGLTIVYYCKKNKVDSLVRGNGDTVGLRMPNYNLLLEIINKVGVPILGPSANFHGEKTPHSYDELDSKFVDLVDYVVKGDIPGRVASTVVDCKAPQLNILRQGGIILDEEDLDN